MAQIQTYECDICHTQKKEVNHWWKGFILMSGTLAKPSDNLGGVLVVPINTHFIDRPLNKEKLPNPNAHLCGFDCVTKWLHQQMQEIINRENTNRTAGSDKVKV
jgi:hypothetical protein